MRVKTEAGWSDATVRNMSERGVALDSHHPPRRNQFVEIARGRCRVVGQIVWSDRASCGLRARDAIDIGGFLAGPRTASARLENDRRASDRATPAEAVAAPLQARAASARWIGRASEFAVMVAGIGCAAAIALGGVIAVLGVPLEQVTTALGAAPG